MADRLIVSEEKYRFRIQWEIDDGDDLGGFLCQSADDGVGESPKDSADWEHWTASRAVRSSPGIQIDAFGAWWESRKEATAALRMAKEALKQKRPLPDWAEKALAEGWTPPKGWKA
jgi:hypothetical protein